jgi:hypothetical protein
MTAEAVTARLTRRRPYKGKSGSKAENGGGERLGPTNPAYPAAKQLKRLRAHVSRPPRSHSLDFIAEDLLGLQLKFPQ